MTETARPRVPAQSYAGDDYVSNRDRPTGWVGWVLYAGVMMIMLGIFQAIAGLVALFDDSYFHVANTNLVVHASYTAYGWTHLLLGLLAIVAGYFLIKGATWARVYAVVLAMVNATVNLTFLNASPVWSTILITIDALIIWSVCVHGGELKGAE